MRAFRLLPLLLLAGCSTTYGLDTCNQDVWLYPGRDIDLNLSNDCNIPPEP
jgi:hypothetical protein